MGTDAESMLLHGQYIEMLANGTGEGPYETSKFKYLGLSIDQCGLDDRDSPVYANPSV